MENASYPVGTCAERCCLTHAVVSGHCSQKGEDVDLVLAFFKANGIRSFKAMAVASNVFPAGRSSWNFFSDPFHLALALVFSARL